MSKTDCRDFLCGPVCFHRTGSIPGQGTKIPHGTWQGQKQLGKIKLIMDQYLELLKSKKTRANLIYKERAKYVTMQLGQRKPIKLTNILILLIIRKTQTQIVRCHFTPLGRLENDAK